MLRRLIPVMLATVVAAAAVAGSALAASSTARFWTALGGHVFCGVEIHAPARPATHLICSSKPIPAPKTGPAIGDPGFVTLGRTGHATPVRTSQDSFEGTTPVALAAGSTWKRLGITCHTTATTVKCTNASGHGFTLTRTTYATH